LSLIVVYACFDDALEVIYQAQSQTADITCAFDYDYEYAGKAKHYDIWVSRTISGNLVHHLAPVYPSFHKDPPSRWRYENNLPIQAYSCWGGMAVLNAEPFYKHHVAFRSASKKGECHASECSIIAKDFWELGYGRVLMVPNAKVAYQADLHLQLRNDKQAQISASTHSYNWPAIEINSTEGEMVHWIFPGPNESACIDYGDWGSPATWEHLEYPVKSVHE
jgi:Cryptococcal mannosyltransferase 1